MRLFSYKLTCDAGFAPNPFHGSCTLATCKPQIRRSKGVGDWIAGFTSGALNGDPVGEERLIYLMEVTAKLTLGDYHLDPRFAAKIPNLGSGRRVDAAGDNIYRPGPEGLTMVPNRHHTPERDFHKDTGGGFVLVSTRFCYFGSRPLVVPGRLRPELPRGQSGQGARTHDPARAQAFIDFVTSQGEGVQAAPTHWPSGDGTWRLP